MGRQTMNEGPLDPAVILRRTGMRLAARTMTGALITDAEAAGMNLRRVISEITK
jgi:hypothetical protein